MKKFIAIFIGLTLFLSISCFTLVEATSDSTSTNPTIQSLLDQIEREIRSRSKGS
jgi:hypothetical protein